MSTRVFHPKLSRAIPTLILLSGVAAAILLLSQSPRSAIATSFGGGDIRTDYYTIHGDIDAELARDLAQRMDAMYEEYSRRLADFSTRDIDRRFEVHVFRRRVDYQKLTGDRFQNTGGVFIPSRNLLAVFLEGQGRDGVRRTLQHEAFHQFAYTVISPNVPPWLNEGLAQVFEEGIWTGSSFILGQVPPRRVRQLQHDLSRSNLVEFRTMLTMTDAEWARQLANPDRSAELYNQAWAMAHFLIYAQDASGSPRFRTRLIDMLKRLHAGEDALPAFVAAFSDNFDGFEHRFREWAQSLQPTPEATYMEHQTVLSDLLVSLNQKGLRFNDLAAFRAHVVQTGYRLQYTRGAIKWETERDLRVYFSDLTGRTLTRDALHFYPRPGTPIADLVRQIDPNLKYRTRFFESAGAIEYEVLVETR